jgi:putative flavoprotein involved in K+ transport
MSHLTDIVIIGAGQAGLATSRCLGDLGVPHVLLERGRPAQRWRSERWDSLRLLTPNWMTRLPAWRYAGDEPDGFMRAAEVASFLDAYARSFAAPVVEEAEVLRVEQRDGLFTVASTRGVWRARGVVVATGHCDRPAAPPCAAAAPGSILQVTPDRYRRPEDLPAGGVLVVGASATGVQLAEELHRSGRPVTLAVGRHTRVPRRYRGRDIMSWLDEAGILDEPLAPQADLAAAYRQTSLQLVGSPEGRAVDLLSLQGIGVRIAGRVAGVEGGTVGFGPDLEEHVARAEAKLRRLLLRIDGHIATQGVKAAPAEPVQPVATGPGPRELDLEKEGIRAIVWATGFRRSYPWLKIPVLDAAGEIRHSGGVTPCPGLSVIGMPFQSRRKSTFIDGVGADAEALTRRIRFQLLDSRSAA